MAAPLPPRNIGATTKELKVALQAALQARLSRMVVELPPGARFGVEKKGAAAAADGGGGGAAGNTPPSPAAVAASDRELARLVVAMFDGLGLGVVALFCDAPAAAAARRAWGPTVGAAVTSWADAAAGAPPAGARGAPPQRPAKPRRGGGFGAPAPPAAPAAAAPPQLHGPGTDVVLVVAPGGAQVARLARLAADAGPGTVLIVLNGRLDGVAYPSPALKASFVGDAAVWERVYLFRPAPHPGWAGGVLYRRFPEPYVLCRKARLGPPTRLAEWADAPPSLDALDAALRAAAKEEPPGGGVLDRVARLFGGE